MRVIYVLLLLSFFSSFSSCQSTSDIAREHKVNTCQDILFLKLKNMNISEMTGSESDYFKEKEKECKEFSEEVKKDKSGSDLTVVLIVIGIVAIAAVPFLISFGGHSKHYENNMCHTSSVIIFSMSEHVRHFKRIC